MKKSYEKPEVAEVKLAAEDAVLTACKAEPPAPGIPDECLRGTVIVVQALGS